MIHEFTHIYACRDSINFESHDTNMDVKNIFTMRNATLVTYKRNIHKNKTNLKYIWKYVHNCLKMCLVGFNHVGDFQEFWGIDLVDSASPTRERYIVSKHKPSVDFADFIACFRAVQSALVFKAFSRSFNILSVYIADISSSYNSLKRYGNFVNNSDRESFQLKLCKV